MKKKWSAEEDSFLKENWQNVDTVKIADFLNRSILGVQRRAQRLQLSDGRVKWTPDQLHLLRSSWGQLSASEIAQTLHRAISTVYQKAFELKLEGARERVSATQRTGSFVACANCGKIRYRPKSKIKVLNFCSHSCRATVLKPSPDTIRKVLLANKLKPNKSEALLDSLLQTHFPDQFAFNGDLSQGVMLGSLVPDFINVNGQKSVIELFGDYWHDKKKKIPWKSSEFGRQAVFSQLGYKLLVVWEHELKSPNDVVEKIKEFNQK